MLLPSGLSARLGPAAAGGPCEPPSSSPPLLVQRHPAAGSAPFRFEPRAMSLPRGHTLFEDGDIQRHLYLRAALTQVGQEAERPRVPEFCCPAAGCPQQFDTLEAYERHYAARHRHVCSACGRSLPSAHLLDVHLLEWHDSLFELLAEKQSMFQCLVQGCPDKFPSSRARKEHLIRAHHYPADFRFDRPKKAKGPGPPGRAQEEAAQGPEEAMEVCSGEDGGAAPAAPERTYSRRVPSTICFGQGAPRGFKQAKRRGDSH